MAAVREFDHVSKSPRRGGSAAEGDAPGGLLVGARLLVVEDQKSQREFIGRMLTDMHAEVDTASSGAMAMAILRTAAFNGMPYHLVLTDLHMPGGDGYQLLKAIRMDTGIRTMPVVILSADSDEEVILRCASLGISSYIQKPAAKSELRRVIANALACSAQYMRDRDEEESHRDAPSVTRKSLEDLRDIVLHIAAESEKGETSELEASTSSNERLTRIVLEWIDRALAGRADTPTGATGGPEPGAVTTAITEDDPRAAIIDDEDPAEAA